MVALNQNAVKSFFGLKSENYLIGKLSHLLYTTKRAIEHTSLRETHLFTIFRKLSAVAAGIEEIL